MTRVAKLEPPRPVRRVPYALTRGAPFPKIAPTFAMKSALVVGAGVTGCSAALELARRGTSVTVLERSGRLGGKVLSYCCKATDSCSRCGVCIAHDAIAEAIRHPKIRFLPNAAIESVDDSGARISVTATVAGPRIDLRACIDCGKMPGRMPREVDQPVLARRTGPVFGGFVYLPDSCR